MPLQPQYIATKTSRSGYIFFFSWYSMRATLILTYLVYTVELCHITHGQCRQTSKGEIKIKCPSSVLQWIRLPFLIAYVDIEYLTSLHSFIPITMVNALASTYRNECQMISQTLVIGWCIMNDCNYFIILLLIIMISDLYSFPQVVYTKWGYF